jgi:predicted ATPase/class 3 adenylate cyclase
MLAMRDYREPTRIGSGADSIVYRAWRRADGVPDVLKVSRLAHPPAAVVARFEKEHALLASLSLDGVVGTSGLLEVDGQLVLLVEDFGGVDLSSVLQAGRVPLVAALRIAVQGAEALAGLHAAGILHKDVNPANVLLNERTGRVKLADLGLASRLPREAAALSRERALHGTVRYIAPEQTGRMNRAVDARSDLYSYGATLYELFTGRPPFAEGDRAALVHAHIAILPVDPDVVETSLPDPIARIISKLLVKDPDARYQAAATLARDLRTCLDAIESGGPIAPFEIGVGDVDDRFRLSQVVVGRSQVLSTLRAAASSLSSGAPRALWVTGAPGIGKSVLVGELEREVASLYGSFARGKFDESRRGVPYQGLLDALDGEVQSLLRGEEAELDRMRLALLNAIGENGALMVDVLPSLEAVIGTHAAPPPLPGVEARKRFIHTFIRTVQTFSSPERPLVLFIDDLQRADAASVDLFGDLLTEPRTSNLLFIGAWRDGEVDETHAVHRLRARLTQAEVQQEEVHLGPLDTEAVGSLVAATLRVTPEAAADLSEVVFLRTGGNPFFVGQVLEKLHRDGLLRFDQTRRSWGWDLEQVANASLVDDIAVLLAGRLDALPAETARVLERAALLGHEIDLQGLCEITELEARDVVAALEPAVAEGLVHPTASPRYAVEERDGRQTAVLTGGRWRFLHDRVQEAAYGRLSAVDRTRLHLLVGRSRLGEGADDEKRSDLFDILRHFDGGLADLNDAGERARLATLYAAGARRAVDAVAIDVARRLARTGLDLIGEHGWQSDHGTTLGLWRSLARAARADGDIAVCKEVFAEVQPHAKGLHELQVFYGVLADLHASRSEVQESFQVGLDALAVAGRKMPAKAGIPNIVFGLIKTKMSIGRRKPSDVAALPDNTDPDVAIAVELLMRAAPAALNTSPNHYPLLVFDMTRLQVAHGLTRQGCFSFSGYAVLLCAMGDVEGGLAYADVALGLLERFDEKVLEAVTLASVYWNVAPWRQHLSECVDPLLRGARSGLDNGDIQFMGTSAAFSQMMLFFVGAQLDDVVASWDEWSPYYDRHHHGIGRSFGATYRQLTHNLQASAEDGVDPLQLSGPFWDEAREIPILQDQKRLLELYLVWTGKALLAWSYRKHALAAEYAEKAIALEQAAPSFPCHIALHCTAAMGALAAWDDLDAAARKAGRKRAQATLKKLAKHEARAPMNLAWRHLLLKAEVARVDGRISDAMSAWEAGIELAQEHGYRADAAAACLRMGEFLRATGRERMARVFIADGWFLLRRWGAHGVAQALLESEAWLEQASRSDTGESGGTQHAGMTRQVGSRRGSVGSRHSDMTQHTVTSTVATTLDADALLKASQAISGEIELGPLVTKLLSVCCENAGAKRGALILEEAGALRVCGVQGVNEVDFGAQLDDTPAISSAIVRYAWRSGSLVVLDDAAAVGDFAGTEDVSNAGLRSVLAAPLVHQGRVQGVVYLDNNLVAGAFTEERARLVTVLAGQAAISVRNAQLYAAQVAQKEAFARFVPKDFLRNLSRDDINDVGLGEGVEKEMAVMFTDLRGFTDISEGMSPTALMAFLNEHLGFMGPAISRHQGFIDKFIGDAILALFDSGADAAVQAGIAMQRAHAAFNELRVARGDRPVGLGLGIHTGPLTLGTIGNDVRLSCTVLGDTVNLASRVESLTKHYGAPMLITGETVRRLPDPARYGLRVVDSVAVKGRRAAVTLHEVLDAQPEDVAARRRGHAPQLAAAQELWRSADFGGAVSILDEIIAADADDRPAVRLRAAAQDMVERGTPEGWDGVLRLDHK